MEVEISRKNQALFDAHPRYWEPLLIVDRLENPLRELSSIDHSNGPVATPQAHSRSASAEFILQHLQAFQVAVNGLQRALENDVVISFGELGRPGDPVGILSACSLILIHCRTLVQVENAILHTPLYSDLQSLQGRCAGLAAENIAVIRKMITQMRTAAEQEQTDMIIVDAAFSNPRLINLTSEARSFLPTQQINWESNEKSGSGCGGCLAFIGFILIAAVIGIVAPWWIIVIFVGLCLIASKN